MKHTRATLPLLLLAAAVATAHAQQPVPGVWAEFESGGWHHDAKAHAGASGGRRVSWFDQPGRASFVDLTLPAAVPRAVVFVRYSRADLAEGRLRLSFGPAAPGSRPEQVPQVGEVKVPATGGFEKYGWTWMPVGDLAAGPHRLVVHYAGGGATDLDVAGVVPDDAEGRWLPPSAVAEGRFQDAGRLGEAPRPDRAVAQQDLQAERMYENPAMIPVLKNYRTTWFGNSGGMGWRNKGNWIQNNVFALWVAPDGTVYANSPWDEGGREAGIYRDGKVAGQLADTHDNLGGYAIVSDGTHIFAAMKNGFVRRYGMDGRPANFPDGERGGSWRAVGGAVEGPRGLALLGDELFIGLRDPDEIAVYGAADLVRRRTWPVARCGHLAAGPDGNLWALETAGDGAPARIRRFDPAGKELPGGIDDVPQASTIAFDHQGRLLVGDNGPDQQIRIYALGGTAATPPAVRPTLVATFGVKGGVFAEPRGAMGPDRLYGITAVGSDAAGNLYVNCNGWGWSGTDLRCFAPDGRLKWQAQGLFFVDMTDADPEDETQVFGAQERFVLDYDAPAGQGWTHVDYTLDPFRYPNDPRAIGMGGKLIRVHRFGGKRFLAGYDMDGTYSWLYRFDGRIAVPCVAFLHAGDKPRGRPAGNRALWRDLNGDGDFQPEEFQAQGEARDGIGGLFDANGDYWQPTWNEHIRHWPMKGLDANGIPIYDAEPASTVKCPGDFIDMERIEYIPATDTMYISGYTAQWPMRDRHFIPAGTAIGAYPRWKEGNRTAAWLARLPYSMQPYSIPKSMSIAGDYVFVNYAGEGNEQIVVFDNRDGRLVGRFVPGPEIGGTHGDADIPWAVKAIQRKDGSYAVFVEDDRYAKQVLYLWKP